MSQPPATSDEELLYQGQVFSHAHPDRLAVLATLFGMQQAPVFLDLLHEAAGRADNAYGRLLRDEANRVKGTSDAALYHEHLEAANQPVAFHEFADRAAAHGLQYLSEAH